MHIPIEKPETCEACPNSGELTYSGNLWLCEDCLAKEPSTVAPTLRDNPRESRYVELVNKWEKSIPQDRRQYFVKQMYSIVDMEKEFGYSEPKDDESRYRFANELEKIIVTARERITSAQQLIREEQGSAQAAQRYLNQLVPQLRAEYREQFKQYDINYKPVTPVSSPTVSKSRMSATDKAYENIAKQLGISVEQYKSIMAQQVKATTGYACTCSETPGICKLHPKT